MDDENHPDFDEQENDNEQQLTQCQHEALEASQEAATAVFLDYIQKSRKRKNRSLLKRLVSALAEFQTSMGEEE